MARSRMMLCLAVVALVALVAEACILNTDCSQFGGQCVNGLCKGTIECRANIDCLPRGIYTKCSNGKCVKSSHKICITNSDCKKNKLNRKCKNSQCV